MRTFPRRIMYTFSDSVPLANSKSPCWNISYENSRDICYRERGGRLVRKGLSEAMERRRVGSLFACSIDLNSGGMCVMVMISYKVGSFIYFYYIFSYFYGKEFNFFYLLRCFRLLKCVKPCFALI